MPDTHAVPDPQLLAAYRATHYLVRAPGRDLQLHIDQYDAQLAKLLREAWVDSAALITAWNPGSQRQASQLNHTLQSQLVNELEAAGHPCLRGRNEPAVESVGEAWHEESVLALGITMESARAIAARYGQVAFVWIDQDATPRLMLTAAETS